jgi:hypothetical protein
MGMAKTRETTYHCYECGERHPRPEHYDVHDLSPFMRMVAFMHAIGQDPTPYLSDKTEDM